MKGICAKARRLRRRPCDRATPVCFSGLVAALLFAPGAQAQDPATYQPLPATTAAQLAPLPALPLAASAAPTDTTAPTTPQVATTAQVAANTPARPAALSASASALEISKLGLSPLRSDLAGQPVEAGQPAFSLERLPRAVRRADAIQQLIRSEGSGPSDQANAQQLASLSPPPTPSLSPPPVTTPPEPGPLVITMIGDVGLAENRSLKTANSASYWARYTKGLEPLIDGDFNFLNLETVVTDRPLRARSKTFAFQTHDTALAHLAQDLGFNLFSLANNHSGDFRHAGQLATLAALNTHAPDAIYHGLGTEDELLKVREFQHQGMTIAFAAIGISSGAPRPKGDTPGQFFIRKSQDWDAVIQAFKVSNADLKILSVHEGTEKVSAVEGSLKRKLRQARDEAGVDLVIGHHPHVVRALEYSEDGSLIAYSLGNGLLFGAANIDSRPLGRDFGLFLRLHYWFDGKEVRLEAVEGVALRGMHDKARPRSARQSARRFGFLNRLSRVTSGDLGLQFQIKRDGQGLWCAPTQQAERAQALCDRPRSAAADVPLPAPEATTKTRRSSSNSSKSKKRGTTFKSKR